MTTYEEEKRYITERNIILRELNVEKMKIFIAKLYPDHPKPSSDEVVQASMHKLRFNLPYFTRPEKLASLKWLTENSYTTDMI